MGEYAEDAILAESVEGQNNEDWESVEDIPTAYDVAEYQLATVFYDFRVHPEAQEQILSILKFYGDNLVKELL
jgi:hypothetical protein